MTDDEIIAVVQAHKEGKKIQFKFRVLTSEVHWHDTGEGFYWDFLQLDYRVAPEEVLDDAI